MMNAPPITVAPQTEHNDDRDLTEISDAETHESAHEWQSVGPAKKRKRTQRQQYSDQPNQAHINTNNRSEALNQQQADGNNDQTQPHTQPIPKPPPIITYGVLNYKKMIENLITEEETFQCKILQNDTIKINTHTTDAYRKLIRHLNSEKLSTTLTK
jgi:hypothetical protein